MTFRVRLNYDAYTIGEVPLDYSDIRSLEVSNLPHDCKVRIFDAGEDIAIVFEEPGEEPHAVWSIMKESGES